MADFLLTRGGPFDALLVRLGLMKPEARSVTVRAALVLALLSWAPLLVLSALEGQALGPGRLPFLLNITEHVRSLVAVPLFLLGEALVNTRLAVVVEHFTRSGVVVPADAPNLEAALAEARRRRSSVLNELLLVVFAYALSGVSIGIMRGVPRDWLYPRGAAQPRRVLVLRLHRAVLSLPPPALAGATGDLGALAAPGVAARAPPDPHPS